MKLPFLSDMRHGKREKRTKKRIKTMKENREKRKTGEIRAITADDNNLRKIVGYASVFDKPSEDMGFIEYVRKGAFKKLFPARMPAPCSITIPIQFPSEGRAPEPSFSKKTTTACIMRLPPRIHRAPGIL